MTKITDVYILAGFLGSGKTTLLQQFLEKEKLSERKVAVLLNEIGEYSVDTFLLDTDTPLKELLRGCICCTIKDEVEIQMLSLYQEHLPDAIYIETTGVAHPMDVLDACTSPLLAPYIDMKGIYTVVDGKRWLYKTSYNNKLQRLLEEQIKYGEPIIINKNSQLSEDERSIIKEEISKINPTSPLLFTDYSVIDFPYSSSHSLPQLKDYESAHAEKALKISTMSYTFSHSINKVLFENWLRSIPDTIYRIKGFLRFNDEPNTTYLFQYSYGVPLYSKEILKLPMTLVLIGSNLDKNDLKNQLSNIEKSLDT